MAALTGSEKQITWAMDIRAKAIANVEALLSDERAAQFADDLTAVRARFDAETEARWWIDNRNWFLALVPRTFTAMAAASNQSTLTRILR